MPSCFFKGCKEIMEKNQQFSKPHYFRIPQDEVLYWKWKNVIPDLDRSVRHSICSLHFDTSDINAYFETEMPDGSVWQMKRGYVRLKDGAVPSKYLQLRVRKKKFSDASVSNGVSGCSVDDSLSKSKDPLNFSILKNEKDNITDSRWTVTVADKFVGFLFWNPSFSISKHVLIFEDLKIKVFFDGIESDLFENTEIDSLSTMVDIMKDIGDVKLCQSSMKNQNCAGYVLNSSGELCKSCVELLEFSLEKTKRRKQIFPQRTKLEKVIIKTKRKQIFPKKANLEKVRIETKRKKPIFPKRKNLEKVIVETIVL